MDVHGLALDPASNAPIVVLKDREGGRFLPIWVGIIEASAIAFELESVKFARPMTHDLFVQTLGKLGAVVSAACIVDLRDKTYFAEITLRTEQGELVVDARPSDAIALALRAKAPIFCDDAVLAQIQTVGVEDIVEQATPIRTERGAEDKSERTDEPEGPRALMTLAEGDPVLAELPESDFGKYKM